MNSLRRKFKGRRTEGLESLLSEEREGPVKETNQSSSLYLPEMETVGSTFQSRIQMHIINCLFQLLYYDYFIPKGICTLGCLGSSVG